MTKKIYGGMNVTHNVTAQGKRTAQGINDQVFDSDGNLDIDSYTREELLEIISLLPLSHYGTHNYLPAGVSGSFEGASENQSYRRQKIQLEDDGTLVMLRSGTDGSTQGVYYSYMPNALNAANLNLSVNTNKVYRPGYFGNNKFAVGMIGSDEKLAVGYYQTTDNTGSGVFVSLTNGTLDDTQHSGFIVSDITQIQPYGSLQYVMMANDNSLYFFSVGTSSNEFLVGVVRVVYNITAGTFTATRITGWNTKTFYNETVSNTDNITVMKSMISSNIVDKPYLYVPKNTYNIGLYMTSMDFYAAQEPGTQNIRFRVNGDAWITSTSYNTRPQHGFSYTLNLSTKQCSLDAGNDIGSNVAPFVVTDTGSSYIATGNVINSDPLYNHGGYRNLYSCYYYMSTGDTFCLSTPNLSEALEIQYSKFSPNSIYNILNTRVNTSSEFKYGVVHPSFGSSVGSYICGLELLPNNGTKLASRSDAGGQVPSYAVHKPTPNFQFKSLNFGTLNGYEPTTDRNFLPNTNDYRMIISSISGNTITANGGIFISDIRYSQPASYDYHMTGTGTFSITPSVLDNFKTAEYAKVAASWNLSSTAQKVAVLFVPQQTNIPAFVMLSTATTDLKNYVKIMEVNVNTRSGNITTLTFKRTVYENADGTSFNPNSIAYVGQASTGLIIYDMGDNYFIGGTNPVFHEVIGNTATPQFRSIVNKASGQFTDFKITGYHATFEIGTQPAAVPGLGFGVFVQADQSNKIVFKSCGTTLADYNAWTDKADPIVMVSQDVAQGFIVYFTEETPVMLSGKSFTMPVTNINLTTIKANPANSTFYIYVKMDQGVAKYVITEDVISETGTSAYNVFWIGTVKTDSLQILSVDVLKRSRLDVFGAALEATGSAFPVSYGLPSNTGTINW